MKTKTLKSAMAVLVVLFSLNANAYDVEIDGIYYNVVKKTKTAEVTSGNNEYVGKVSIPSSFEYEGVTYSVTSIGYQAFRNCTNLESVIIPNSVTSIGGSAFAYCNWMNSVTIPNSVTSIGDGAFSGCRLLKSVNIDDLVAWCNIEFEYSTSNPLCDTGSRFYTTYLYINGTEVKDLVIPNSITSINKYAFCGYKGLSSVKIPNSVERIGRVAFWNCTNLNSVEIPNSVTSIEDNAFYGCSNLTSLNIPNSIERINENTFQDCSSLTSLVLSNNVKYISKAAFKGCSGLTSITFGNSITSIGESAFEGCKNIEDVYCYMNYRNYMLSSSAFQDAMVEYATLHVPIASYDDYKSDEQWKAFGTIVALDGDTPEPKKCATPTITYTNGKLSYGCATEAAEFISEITDADIKKYYTGEVELSATYSISVYATATGYENSETVTATLCWIDSEPKTEGIANSVAEVNARPVLIQSQNGQITLQGVDDNTPVAVYTLSGIEVGNTISSYGTATISTNMNQGEPAIIKIGKRSVKVLVK